MKNIVKIILLGFISVNMFASGGSIYSRFGKGDLNNFYFARQMAIGGGGASLFSGNNIMLYNPAGISGINVTRIETGLNSSGTKYSTNSQNVVYTKTNFSGFVFAIPIERSYGIALSIGILPVTNVNYAVKKHVTNSTTGDYDLTLEGSGGISKLFIGTSYRLPFGWVLGAEYQYYTGKIDYKSKLEFTKFSGLQNADFTNSNGHHGMGASFGLISDDLSGIFNSANISEFRIGAFFNYFANLRTDSVFIATSSVGESEIVEGTILTNIPYKFGIGASIKLSNSYLFMLDYLYQPWSQYEISGVRSDKLKNYSKISFGFEYRNIDRKQLSFWQRIALRAGVSYENTQYTINGEDINQIAIHAGVGLPIAFNNTLDIGFMIGKRGVKDNNLIQEQFYKIEVSLSFGELWFVRQER